MVQNPENNIKTKQATHVDGAPKHRPHAPKPRLAGAPAPMHKGSVAEERPQDPDKKQAAKGAQFIGLVFAAYVAFLFRTNRLVR